MTEEDALDVFLRQTAAANIATRKAMAAKKAKASKKRKPKTVSSESDSPDISDVPVAPTSKPKSKATKKKAKPTKKHATSEGPDTSLDEAVLSTATERQRKRSEAIAVEARAALKAERAERRARAAEAAKQANAPKAEPQTIEAMEAHIRESTKKLEKMKVEKQTQKDFLAMKKGTTLDLSRGNIIPTTFATKVKTGAPPTMQPNGKTTSTPELQELQDIKAALASTAKHADLPPTGFGAESEGDKVVFGHIYGARKGCQLGLCKAPFLFPNGQCQKGLACPHRHAWPTLKQMEYLASQPDEAARQAFRTFCATKYAIWRDNWERFYKNTVRDEPVPKAMYVRALANTRTRNIQQPIEAEDASFMEERKEAQQGWDGYPAGNMHGSDAPRQANLESSSEDEEIKALRRLIAEKKEARKARKTANEANVSSTEGGVKLENGPAVPGPTVKKEKDE